MMDLRVWLTVAAVLFALGAYGVLVRKNAIGVLLSVELMANAVNLVLVSFGRYSVAAVPGTGQTFALFAIALTVVEVVIGIALVVLLHRTKGDVLLTLAQDLRR